MRKFSGRLVGWFRTGSGLAAGGTPDATDRRWIGTSHGTIAWGALLIALLWFIAAPSSAHAAAADADTETESAVADDSTDDEGATAEDPAAASGDKGKKKKDRAANQPKDGARKNAPAQPAGQPAGAQPPKPGAAPAQPGGAKPAGQPRPAQPDRIQQLLDQLDPSMLQLSGAELSVEIVNGQVVIVGNEQDVKAVEAIMRVLDESSTPKEIRVVQVFENDAKAIAQSIQEALRDGEKSRTQEDQTSIKAVSSNTILVSALPEDMDMIIDLIEKVDAVPNPLGKLDTQLLTFQIKYLRASEVAKELTEMLKKIRERQGFKDPKGDIQVVPNNANNTIMVIAGEEDRANIQRLIDQLDVEPDPKYGGATKLTLFPLQHSKATELAEVLEKLIKTTAEGGDSKKATEEAIQRLILSRVGPDGKVDDLPPIDLGRATRIIPDEGTQSLIVATNEKNVEPMGELIRLLDGVPLAAELNVRLFPLIFADAQTIADTVKTMFEDAKKLPEDPGVGDVGAVPQSEPGKSLMYNVVVAVDGRTNTLIASGRAEQLKLVEKIVTDLDRPALALKFPLHLIPIRNVDATRISQMLKTLFDNRIETAEATEAGKASVERDRVLFSVDIRSNTLIVSASEENVAEIRTIVAQLDIAPGKTMDQIHVITCQRLAASDIKEKIDELWQRKATLIGVQELPEDSPVVAVDERSNSLIVAASPEDADEIRRLVTALESQPMLSDTRLFKLAYVDATVLTDMLNQLFEGLAGASDAFTAPTIIPDQRGNTLVVAGSQDVMERVDYLVRRLDVEAGPTTAVFKVYPLAHGSAAKIAPRMQELFDSRNEGQDITRTPIAIFAEESSNSVVVSASRDDHETVVELMGLLDRPSSIARQFQIFPLKLAKAATLAEKLKTLFATQAGGSSSSRADAIAAEADERTNSIVVWAAPSEMQNISEVIAKLDTQSPTSEMMVKVIQLKQALAEDFATLLTDTVLGENAGADDERAVIVSFPYKNPDGTTEIRKLLRQDLKVKADSRTNSLMVMAPAESMLMLEAMIQDFDRIRPIRSEVRLFPLINSDAESMVEKLTELFQADDGAAADGPKSQLVFGDMPFDFDVASVGQDLRFTADTRTNTVIAAGAEVDLRMVEQIIRYLDAQEAENRRTEVVPVSYRKAQDLASAVQAFNDQEQEVFSATEDQESQRLKAERQISIEALGAEGEEGGGSSTLIVGASRQRFDQALQMIQALDRPEPQVRISVLIAEVSLTDSVELGMEIAGRDLDFSRQAVLGPNGVVLGPDFDWVSGTDLGAAGLGLGGFNFTVTGEDFSFLMHAVQQDSRLEILSRPVLVVRNGEKGKLTIADDVPFVGSTQINDTGSTNSTIDREEVGIILDATPHISPDGYVTIELTQELSNFSGENVQLTEGLSSPVFSKRTVETNVTVRDGETVVVGGLITSRESESENKVPIIGDLPLIGPLARFNSVSTTKTELLVVLTVDVLRTDEDFRNMSEQQRDLFVLPDNIRQSPLMEGLRIRADEPAMGPTTGAPAGRPAKPTAPARSPERDLYGPRPRTYGPVIAPPPPTSTSTAARTKAYGPKMAQTSPVTPPVTEETGDE